MHAPLPTWVDTEPALLALISALQGIDTLIVDTEFHAERRFLPELMLVQLGTVDGRVWAVDPRRLDLRPLGPILGRVTWVLHGGQADVQLLFRATGAQPRALWDTQVMAGLLGLDYPLRLDVLSRHVLDQPLDKGATLTDWAQRPLRPEQLRYAAADVVTTAAVWRMMWELLDDERRRWALAAGAELVEEALAPPDPNRSWRGLDVAPELDAPTRAALDGLSRWRLRAGAALDQPPFGILSDGLLLDLARRRPADLGALADNRRIPIGLVKRHGEAILGELRAAALRVEQAPSAPSRDQLQLARALQVWASAVEQEKGLAARLLLAGDRAVLVAQQGLAAWTGWRQEAAGAALADLLEGRATLRLVGGKIRIGGP